MAGLVTRQQSALGDQLLGPMQKLGIVERGGLTVAIEPQGQRIERLQGLVGPGHSVLRRSCRQVSQRTADSMGSTTQTHTLDIAPLNQADLGPRRQILPSTGDSIERFAKIFGKPGDRQPRLMEGPV